MSHNKEPHKLEGNVPAVIDPASNALTGPSEDVLNLLEANANAGLENVQREDISIPFLGILQDLSPQVKRTEAAYIEGAQVGMFFDGSTKTPLDGMTGILLIPILFDKVYNVWRNRKAGGGFKGSFKTRIEAEKRIHELSTHSDPVKRIPAEQIDIVDTALHYVLYQVPSTGQWRRAVLSCKSTMLGPSRQWNLAMGSLELPRARGTGTFTPPSWGTIYHMTTRVKRDATNAWYVFDTNFVGLVTDNELLAKASALYKSLGSGEVKLDFNKDTDVSENVEAAAASAAAAGRPSF